MRRHDVSACASTGLTADEPEDMGGEDMGPSPQELLAASLASCTAITMEMYAKRKGWNVDGMEVDVRLPAGRARLRDPLRAHHEDARPPQRRAGPQAAGDRRQVPGAPHARGRGRLRRTGRAHAEPEPARRAVGRAAGARGGAGDGRPRPHGLGRARAAVPRRGRRAARGLHAPPRRPQAPPGRDLLPRRAPDAGRDAASRPRCARPTRRSGCRRAPSTCSARSSRRRPSSPTTRSIRSSG